MKEDNTRGIAGLAQSVYQGFKYFMLSILAILVILYLVSNIFKVSQNEIAIIERFGKPILPPAMPGVHFAMPYPIDRIRKVPIKFQRIYINDFIDVDTKSDSYSNILKKEFNISPYCITGDNNIIKLACTVQYKIIDPVKYLYKIRSSSLKKIIHFSTSNIIMHTVASCNIDYIFTHRKDAIRDEIKLKIKKSLKKLNAGVDIVFIELKEISPPEDVQEAFDNVINSKNEKETIINMANTRKNKNLYEATSNADRLLMEAKAYKKRLVSKTSGKLNRYEKLYSNYLSSPELTIEKLYRTSMTEILKTPVMKFSRSKNADGQSVKLKLMPFVDQFTGM